MWLLLFQYAVYCHDRSGRHNHVARNCCILVCIWSQWLSYLSDKVYQNILDRLGFSRGYCIPVNIDNHFGGDLRFAGHHFLTETRMAIYWVVSHLMLLFSHAIAECHQDDHLSFELSNMVILPSYLQFLAFRRFLLG